MSIHQQIAVQIAQTKGGKILFPTDFRGTGSDTAIKMSLSRFALSGVLLRITHGIYMKPKTKQKTETALPGIEELAEAIALKERLRIKPAEAYAQYKLGLTSIMPDRLAFVTDGEPRKVNVGEKMIVFKATTPKKLAMEGPVSSLLIQVLEDLGPTNIDPELQSKITALMETEHPKLLASDLKKAPAWIYKLLWTLQKKNNEHENSSK